MPAKTIIIDYGTCNVHSVYKRMLQTGLDVSVSSDPASLKEADKIILPGIGHFDHAMKSLNALNLVDALNEGVLVKKKPVLGICLGMQLMAEKGTEGGVTKGLGWIKGTIKALTVQDQSRFKIPHMGWNTLQLRKRSNLAAGITGEHEFYFTHSYHLDAGDQDTILGITGYGIEFVSAIEQEHIFGVQFHPEKSHVAGSLLLKNFAAL